MSSTNQPNTIFLTPGEDERIKKTFEGRLQKCQELSGQPRVPSDQKSLRNQITMASLLSDFSATPESASKARKGRPDAIVTFAVGKPYPPCTLLLRDLNPMKFSDLRMDTHHRGRVLTIRRVSPVVKLLASSWTIVQEESSGDTERLEISLHKENHGKDTLESGSVWKLKEPYFTLSDEGQPTLRIDHPSDLVVYTNNNGADNPHFPANEVGDSEGVAPGTTPTVLASKTAMDLKEEGNAALQKRDLSLTHALYTQGLGLVIDNDATKDDVTRDLFRNRAHVNLLLNRLDEAKKDALASLVHLDDQKHKELDGKAYLRAGTAAYNLGDFQEANHFFQEQQRLMPGHKEGAARLRKTKLRLKEQTTGVYDLKKIKIGLSMTHPRVDVASFTCNVEVRESTGRGRGLFATRDIELGEIILCEKAFCVVWGHEDEALTMMTYDARDSRIRVCPAGLWKVAVQKLLDNPSQVEKMMDLYGDYHGTGKQLIMRDSNPVVDTFQVYDIVGRNAFGPGSVDSSRHAEGADISDASAGLWILASYCNHSCIPNAMKESIGDLMILRTTQRISAGEEITHSYDASSDYDARAAALMKTWDFACICDLCNAEKADGQALRKKRRDIENEANALVEADAKVGAKRLSIVRARRLARSINDTYNDERYKGLPRPALARIQEWLAKAATR